MELSKERLERLRELLAPAHQQIVIVSHTNPDATPWDLAGMGRGAAVDGT